MEDTTNEVETMEALRPKRYLVTAQFYVYGSDVVDATRQANEFARSQDALLDNKCQVTSVVISEAGKLYLGRV